MLVGVEVLELDTVDAPDVVELSESTLLTVAGESAATCIGGRLRALPASSLDPTVLPRLRVARLAAGALVATLGCLLNSSALDLGSRSAALVVAATGVPETVALPNLGETGGLSLRSLDRKKLMPRIDLRPLLRSSAGLVRAAAGVDTDAGETELRSV